MPHNSLALAPTAADQRAESAEGVSVALRQDGDDLVLELPLDVADIVLLPAR